MLKGKLGGDAWRNLQVGIECQRQFGRMAVLVDKRREEWGSKRSPSHLYPVTEAHFPERRQVTLAEVWARGGGKAGS